MGKIIMVHRKDQIESGEILRHDLPRAQAGQIITPHFRRALHRRVRRFARVPIAGACAIKGQTHPARSGQMPRHGLGGGGSANIAKAEHKNMCHAGTIRERERIMKIVILTGAGISAESGLQTFRAEDGLWEGHRVEDVATPEAFERSPRTVTRFYNARRIAAAEARPNAAHSALARLAEDGRHEVVLITQNVDDLHERAGSEDVIHMHGSLAMARCYECNVQFDAPMEMIVGDPCPGCGAPTTRPDIVWFGEMPYQMEEISAALSTADLFVSIGTSGNVYPAAGFVEFADRSGAATLELNLEASNGVFEVSRQGPATALVPQWVEEMLG